MKAGWDLGTTQWVWYLLWPVVLFLVQFNNFDWNTTFYGSYMLLFKPPVLMRSCGSYWQLFSCSLEVGGRAQEKKKQELKEEEEEAHFQQVRDLINHYDDGYRHLVRWSDNPVKICPKPRLFPNLSLHVPLWHKFTQLHLWVNLLHSHYITNPPICIFIVVTLGFVHSRCIH